MVLKTFSCPGYLRSEDVVVWLMHLLVNFLYINLTMSCCYGSILSTLVLIERDGGLSTLFHKCGFACQKRVLKTFPGPGYFRQWGSLAMSFTGKFVFIYLTVSSCYKSIPWTLALIGRDGSVSTLCHSCGFPCQQKLLNTFPGPGYLRYVHGVVWIWHLLVNLCIYSSLFNLATAQSLWL